MLFGETGIAVQMVQQALLDLGYSIPDGATAFYGNQTAAAVSQFKVDNGVTPSDGVVGVKTMTALDGHFPVVNLFQTFVNQGRLDASVAGMLNELHTFSPVSWANQTAHFAFAEMDVGNLAGIVRASQANGLAPFLPASAHAALQNYVNLGNISNNGETNPATDGGVTKGYCILRNDIADGVTNRRFSKLVMAHELTHFRNRTILAAVEAEPGFPPTAYVNPVLAQTTSLPPSNFKSNRTRAIWCDEITCRHVAWHVSRDLDFAFHDLASGALFLSARGFTQAAAHPNADYQDSGYMAALIPLGNSMSQQVAMWLTSPVATQELFHYDTSIQDDVRFLIAAEAAFAVSVGFTFAPTVVADGLA
jgi:hypothetical protein